jgi:hypothetical protein
MSYLYICDRCGLILQTNNTTYRMSIENVNGVRSSLSMAHLCKTCREDLALFLNGEPIDKAVKWKQVIDDGRA